MLGWHVSLSRVQPAQRAQRKSLLKELTAAVSASRVQPFVLSRLRV